MARDHLRAAISEQLAPLLVAAGFRRTQPKHFISVSGDLVRQVGVQLSQWGGQSFYLHLYVNTLLDPLGTLHGYRVGRRLQGAPDRVVPWDAPTEDRARAAIASVVAVLNDGQLAWLTSVASLRDYVFEFVANPQSTIDDFEIALVLARAGETSRPWWIAEGILQEKPGADDTEYRQHLRARAKQLQSAIKAGTVQPLLEGWRAEYIEANRLGGMVT